MQQNKIDNQNQERNIMEKKLEECDTVIKRLSEGLHKQENELLKCDTKVQEKIAATVRQQLKNEINQYKFEIYHSSLFN